MARAANDHTSEKRPVPRARLIALYVLAVAFGLVPYTLFIQSWLFLLVTTIFVAVTAVLATRTNTHYAGQSPAPIEVAIGLLGCTGLAVVCGLFGFIFYFLVWKVLAGFAWLFGWGAANSAETWATGVSACVAWFFPMAMTINQAPELIKKLYPSLPGQRSPYFALSLQPGRLRWLLGQAIIGVLAMLLILLLPYFDQFIGPLSWIDPLASYSAAGLVALSAYWTTITQDFWETKDSELLRVSNQPLVAKIKELMEAAGYQVRTYPQTGNKEADPLIALLDFFAIRPDQALAGRVKANTDTVLLHHELASLQPAVWALEDQLSKDGTTKIDLEPILVLIGGTSNARDDTEALASISKMNVRIIRTPAEAELNEIIADKDTQRKARRAKELFDPPASNPVVSSVHGTASSASAAASPGVMEI